MVTDVETWERERLMEALDAYNRGLSEAPYIRKWCSAGPPSPLGQAQDRPWASFPPTQQTRSVENLAPPETTPNTLGEINGGGTGGPMTFVVSTDEVDRHGDTISVEGWRLAPYMRNPVFLWAHNYTRPAIGRAVDLWKEDHRLMAMIEFAPTEFAREVATLYQAGYQKGVSVGFRPLQYDVRWDRQTGEALGIHFVEQELLEISAAPVPANQSALRKALDGWPRMQGYYSFQLDSPPHPEQRPHDQEKRFGELLDILPSYASPSALIHERWKSGRPTSKRPWTAPPAAPETSWCPPRRHLPCGRT